MIDFLLAILEFTRIASARQVFFESFSRVAMQMVEERAAAVQSEKNSQSRRPPPLIMLTGGLRTRAQFVRVLEQKHAHLLGLGRGATLRPTLPRDLYECSSHSAGEKHVECDWSWETLPDPEPKSPSWWPRIVGAAVGVSWYNLTMRRQAEGHDSVVSSAKARPYLYSPETHWLMIVLDMYIEPLAEFIFPKLPFVSFLASYNSSRDLGEYLDTSSIYMAMLFSLFTSPLILDYVFFHLTLLRTGQWYIQVGWICALLYSVFSISIEYVVLRRRLRIRSSVQ